MRFFKENASVRKAFTIIENGLSKKYPELAKLYPEDILPYHGESHSLDVLKEAMLFAMVEGQLSEHELELLAIAAAYHDTGFTEQYDNNEELGAEIARKNMESADGFSEEDIVRVQKAILGTKVKPGPSFSQMVEGDDLIGKILADADVSSLGRDDFHVHMEKDFQELVGIGKIATDTQENREKYFESTRQYFSGHKWQTEAARRLRAEKEQENFVKL